MRFTIRRDDTFLRCGVWDDLDKTWRTPTSLPWVEAERISTDLNMKFGPQGPRPAETARRVDPPTRAEARLIAHRWQSGSLDVWIREPDGWYGHLWYDDGTTAAWFPAERLRPLDDA